MNGFLDGLFEWVNGFVETLMLKETDWLAFLVFAFAVWLGSAFTVKVLTVMGSHVLPFLCRVGIATTYLLTLNADYLLTRIIRRLGGKPLGLVYAIGEVTTKALPRLMDGTRAGGRWWLRESRTLANRKLLILVTAVIVGWWNGTYCERRPAQACEPPSSSITEPLSSFTDSVASFLGGDS